MIHPIPDLPDNVVAVTATGTITAEDYESVIIPAIEQAHDKHGKIRMLYQIESDMCDYTAGALWDDTKVGLKHFAHFEKIAVVTDNGLITASIKTFAFLMPGEVRIFSNTELEEAKTWIVE